MANLKSSKKDIRRTERRTKRNLNRDNQLKTESKVFIKLVENGEVDKAKTQLNKLYKAIDKSKKSSRIKKNTASRKKSRFAQMLGKLEKKVAS